MKLMNILLVAMMLFGLTAGIVAAAQSSSDVITASNAGGGELTNQDIWIIVLIVVGIAVLVAIL